MRFVLPLVLAAFAAGETGPADIKVPLELSNDYFAADAKLAHMKELTAAAAADLEATYGEVAKFCSGQSGAPGVDPANAKRLICVSKK